MYAGGRTRIRISSTVVCPSNRRQQGPVVKGVSCTGAAVAINSVQHAAGYCYEIAEEVDMKCTPDERSPRTRRTSEVNLSESRTGRRSSRASSEGSWVHPSMGIPFAGGASENDGGNARHAGHHTP